MAVTLSGVGGALTPAPSKINTFNKLYWIKH